MLKIVKYLQETHCQDYLCSEMSKRFIWTLAVFMALAMLGLILVQTYWINNAYQLKENQFSQLVNRALNNDKVRVYLYAKKKGNRVEGEVVEVLKRARDTFVGTIEISTNL